MGVFLPNYELISLTRLDFSLVSYILQAFTASPLLLAHQREITFVLACVHKMEMGCFNSIFEPVMTS